jgi:hypothetical protein
MLQLDSQLGKLLGPSGALLLSAHEIPWLYGYKLDFRFF